MREVPEVCKILKNFLVGTWFAWLQYLHCSFCDPSWHRILHFTNHFYWYWHLLSLVINLTQRTMKLSFRVYPAPSWGFQVTIIHKVCHTFSRYALVLLTMLVPKTVLVINAPWFTLYDLICLWVCPVIAMIAVDAECCYSPASSKWRGNEPSPDVNWNVWKTWYLHETNF